MDQKSIFNVLIPGLDGGFKLQVTQQILECLLTKSG